MKVVIVLITIFLKIRYLVAFNNLYHQIIGSKKKCSCNLQMSAVKDMDGILPPTGFFDPLQLSLGKSEAELKKWREAELKHGRLSMLLATVGIIVACREISSVFQWFNYRTRNIPFSTGRSFTAEFLVICLV